MPPSEPSRVFISYAHRDGADLAQRLERSLKERGFDAWLDTQRLRGGAVWSEEIEKEIDERQVTLALLSPASYSSEICRAEQLRSLRKGKRLIPVLAAAGADQPIHLEARQYRDFTDGHSYDECLAQLLVDIRGDATAVLPAAYRKTRITYLTAPPQVANYLKRPEALKAIRNALFAENHRQPIALTALHGMGGIGKTVLAKALTEDEVVRQAFPDGIVWITAGKETKRDFIAEMREVAKALGDDLSGYDNALACENQYRTTIASKAALIVVDDVWTIDDIKPLLAESPRSRFLFTTRDAAIGRFVGAHQHRADLLDVAQSRELLASWADKPVSQMPSEADEIIRECGRLPLALSVVGAMLRGTDAEFWSDTLDLLRKADLSAIQEQLPDGQDSFFKAVEVSFQSLKPETQERYKALAVLLEDMAVPLPILQTLWNVNGAEARRISRNFVDRSLAQRDGADESIRLHDLQLDYVRAQYPDREALDLIHDAIRLSSNAISEDPDQFASQMIGRLLPYQELSSIGKFAKRVAQGAKPPWLRPLQSTLRPPGTVLIRTLAAYAGLNGVALSEDGRLAVSASADYFLTVWDVASGRELRDLEGHHELVTGVAISGDGRLAVSASEDRTLKVWEVASGHEIRTLAGHIGEVAGVAISRDGQLAVSASFDRTLKVWEVGNGRQLRTLKGHIRGVAGVAISRDGQLAVSASYDRTLKVWEVGTGRELRTLVGHTGCVHGVALSADRRLAVSASSDQTLKVWEVASGCELRTLTGHFGAVTGVSLSEDARLAVSASADYTLKVWEVGSGCELRTFADHTGAVAGVALSGDGRLAVSASSDQTLKVWEVARGRELRTLAGHFDAVISVALNGDGRLAVSLSYDNTLKLWDVGSGREIHSFEGRGDLVRGIALSGDGRLAVSAPEDNTLRVWEVATGRELRTLTGHIGPVYGVALSGDGRLAVTASRDQTLKVWEVVSGRELRTLTGHFGPVYSVALSGDGRLAVSACHDKTLKVWEVVSGRELRTLTGHIGPVYNVALSGDGRLAISSGVDMLKVWDVARGRELRTLEQDGLVDGVAISGDGRLAFSAADNTVKVWDLETGEVIATFTCDSAANCCAFSDPLKLIVAGDQGGHVHFLRLEEGKKQ